MQDSVFTYLCIPTLQYSKAQTPINTSTTLRRYCVCAERVTDSNEKQI